MDRARPEQAAPARDEAQVHQRPAGRRLGPRHGVIRTVANGAATVTATATYHGASASTSFVVRVVSDLSDLKVGHVTVAAFPSRGLRLRRDPSGPRHARAAGQRQRATGTVHVTQASGIPGVATVTSTGPDGIVTTYTVNFARAASSDEFNGARSTRNGPGAPSRRPDRLAVGGGKLTIKPEAGDLVTTTNNAKNLLLQPALGDWTIRRS